MENKQSRHYTIKGILDRYNISSQEKLRIELRKKGFDVTQATLSRDLKEMGIGRVNSEHGSQYASFQNSSVKSLRSFIGGEVTTIRSNENLIVVSTLPGCASVVAEYIDVQKNPDILGTLAGDNTLIVVPHKINKTNQLITYLQNILIEGKT